MTPQEKARELVDKYLYYVEAFSSQGQIDNAKQCAVIAVDEILLAISGMVSEDHGYSADGYYKQVKQEILLIQ
jgi:hypothetical protein